MPVLKRPRPPTPISRSRSISPSSSPRTYQDDASSYDSDDTPLDGPVIFNPPPVYQRQWRLAPLQQDNEERRIPENPKYVIPVRTIMRKMKQVIKAAGFDEICEDRLQIILKKRLIERIKQLLHIQKISCYIRYPEILDIYWRYFPQYTNQNLVNEVVMYIKEKQIQSEISSIDRDAPALGQGSADDLAMDRRYVEQQTKQELLEIFKDTPGINFSFTGEVAGPSTSMSVMDTMNEEKLLTPIANSTDKDIDSLQPEPSGGSDSELSDLELDDDVGGSMPPAESEEPLEHGGGGLACRRSERLKHAA